MRVGSLNLMGLGGGGGVGLKVMFFVYFRSFLNIVTTFHSIEKRLNCFGVVSSMKFGESLDDFSNIVHV